jgi:hypothetical protein
MRTNINVVDLTTARKLFALDEAPLIENNYEGEDFYRDLKKYKLRAPKSTVIKSIKTEFDDQTDGCKIIINDSLSTRIVLAGHIGSEAGEVEATQEELQPNKPYTTSEKQAIEDAQLYNLIVKDKLTKMKTAIDRMIATADNMYNTLETRGREITESKQSKVITILT